MTPALYLLYLAAALCTYAAIEGAERRRGRPYDGLSYDLGRAFLSSVWPLGLTLILVFTVKLWNRS